MIPHREMENNDQYSCHTFSSPGRFLNDLVLESALAAKSQAFSFTFIGMKVL